MTIQAMPLANTPDDEIGWQAQCASGDWNSEVHNDRRWPVEDAGKHEAEQPGHGVAVRRVARARRSGS